MPSFELRYFSVLPNGEAVRWQGLDSLPLVCPRCQATELVLDPQKGCHPPDPKVAREERWARCQACETIVPLRLRFRSLGVLVETRDPLFEGETQKTFFETLPRIFSLSHHPWRVLLEAESKMGDSALSTWGEFRKVSTQAGETGGALACQACGQKALRPVLAPGQRTAVADSVLVFFPCPQCKANQKAQYNLSPEGLETQASTTNPPFDPLVLDQWVRALETQSPAEAYQALGHFREGGLDQMPWIKRLRNLTLAELDPPSFRAACTTPDACEVKPLLRRLKDESPLYCGQCHDAGSECSPRRRLAGTHLLQLIDDLKSDLERGRATRVLEALQSFGRLLPFLVKVPEIQAQVGAALKLLAQGLAQRGGKVLSLATEAGLILIDPDSGEVLAELPHMQADSPELARTLGFAKSLAYYKEPGIEAWTAHPLFAGTAWRTKLPGPPKDWIDLGRFVVVETEHGLFQISGSSGKIRWQIPAAELGGLEAWGLSGGSLQAYGDETLFAIEPRSGAITRTDTLPKRGEFLGLVDGSLPAPAAIVDQGYGAGLFAPAEASFKGGVKPIPPAPEADTIPELASIRFEHGRTYLLWESEIGYNTRTVTIGPLGKKFEARQHLLDAELGLRSDLLLTHEGNVAWTPGNPLNRVDHEAEEVLRVEGVDATLGVRLARGRILALGVDSVTGVSPEGKVLFQVSTPGLQAIDIPGPPLNRDPKRGPEPEPKEAAPAPSEAE